MPAHKITRTKRGVRIDITDVAGSEQKVLKALQECQEGRCTCPTPEYSKVAGMEVEATAGSVRVDIKTKPNAELEPRAVGRCLDYTLEKINKAP